MTTTREGMVFWGLMLVGVAAWLWPIGLGGRMPVGGDISAFSIGLMAVLDEALGQGRLPYWNDLWGYGFPGVAESQMGVYYPPYLLLYGALPVEAAYTTSLVLHTFWAAIGTAWAARRFGVSTSGAALAGFVGATSGFYQIHLTHPWGVTTGSWMPWVWGLGWKLRQGEGGLRTWLLLAGAVAIQVLPGHFQLAFETQVGLVILLVSGLGGRTGSIARVLGPPLAMAAAGWLASAQLIPTWRLAKLAETARTWEYLSGFASTPIHLVSYVAPGLFHRSPLWRPVAWDPFHTSPEEHLAYVGLVPLFLAIGVVWREARTNAAIWSLAIVVALTTILSLGPYLPGFSWLIELPGFSFFRAPARWSLASMTALAILSGAGLDCLRSARWATPGRSLVRFVALAIVAPVLLVLIFETALASTQGTGWRGVAAGFERMRAALPWTGDPTFREIMAQARRPQTNPIVVSALLRQGREPNSRLDRMRTEIYWQELWPSAVLLAALLGLASLGREGRGKPGDTLPRTGLSNQWFVLGLVGLSAADLLVMGHLRDLDMGPIASMTEQSPVLSALHRRPRGTRTVDPLGNLSMRAGANPVRAYRTLDLPTMTGLTGLLSSPWSSRGPSDEALSTMRAVGARIEVLNPFAAAGLDLDALRSRGFSVETVDDPALAGWLFGAKWARSGQAGATRFVLVSPEESGEHGFLFRPGAERILSDANPRPPADVLLLLNEAGSISLKRPEPGKIAVGPVSLEPQSLVVLPVQYDSQWRGVWTRDSEQIEAKPLRAFPNGAGGGWLGARSPGPGRWMLSWDYEPASERLGQWVALPAWLVWGLALAATFRGRAVRNETSSTETIPQEGRET